MIKIFLKVWSKWLAIFLWVDICMFYDYHMRSTLFPFMLQYKYLILEGGILFTHKVICVVKFWSADHMCKYLDVYCSLFFTFLWCKILKVYWIQMNENENLMRWIFFSLNWASLFKKSNFLLRKMQLWGEMRRLLWYQKTMWIKMRKNNIWAWLYWSVPAGKKGWEN